MHKKNNLMERGVEIEVEMIRSWDKLKELRIYEIKNDVYSLAIFNKN